MFRNIVENLFDKLDIDWDAGWDYYKKDELGAADYLIAMTDDWNTRSELFRKFDHYCFDIIQSLIILPLEKRDYDDIEIAYKTFIKEFSKIENSIGSDYYNLYILKGIVDSARNLRSEYKNKKTRAQAIKNFSRDLFETVNEVVNFYNPKEVHCEKMLCSLYLLAECCEGVMYEIIEKKIKKKRYDSLPVQSVEEIFGILDVNLEDDYEFTEDTVVVVIDAIKGERREYKLTEEQIEEMNETDSIARGSTLYAYLNGSDDNANVLLADEVDNSDYEGEHRNSHESVQSGKSNNSSKRGDSED
jgi:hypothetical protein